MHCLRSVLRVFLAWTMAVRVHAFMRGWGQSGTVFLNAHMPTRQHPSCPKSCTTQMAPEHLQGVLLKSSDIYSFGVLVWEVRAPGCGPALLMRSQSRVMHVLEGPLFRHPPTQTAVLRSLLHN